MESRGYSILGSSSCVTWFEVGGFIGMLLAGWLSDKFYKGKRGPINLIFSMGVALSVVLLYFYKGGWLLMDSAIIFMVGFFVFGPQMLIGLTAAELSHKNATGAATGFVGWFAYIGAAIAGWPLGVVIQKFGWNGFFVVMMVCGMASALLFLPLCSERVKQKQLSLS